MMFEFLRRKRELSHAEVRELLSSYADRMLEAGQAAKVESHLRQCLSCRNELEAIRITRRLVHSLPSMRPPRSFTLEAAPEPAPMPKSFIYLSRATGLAAAAFVTLLAIRALLPMAGIPQWDSYQAKDEIASSALSGEAGAPTKAADAYAVRAGERPVTAKAQTRAARVSEPAATSAAPGAVAPMKTAAPAAPPEQPVTATPPPETSASDPSDTSDQTDLPQRGQGAGEGGQQEAKIDVQAESAQAAQVGLPAQPPQLVEARPEGSTEQTEAGGFAAILPGLLAATGFLVVVLGAATGAIWWRYRRPFY